ncbi:MAG TPA: hypothetical protein VF236_07160 [Gaiellaceae bacterium]
MRRAALISIVSLALAGCGGAMPLGGVGSTPGAGEAQAAVRSAIPAMEAYYADNGTYTGVSLRKLRSVYDSSIAGVRVASADDRTYCVESTTGSPVFSKRGPAAEIVDGPC